MFAAELRLDPSKVCITHGTDQSTLSPIFAVELRGHPREVCI